MSLPVSRKYKFLETVGPLPRMVVTALGLLGIKEIPGKGYNPIIKEMARLLGVSGIYVDDDVSWCGLFIAYVMKLSDKPMPYKAYEILRAASFVSWGTAVELADMKLGDIVVYKRPGGNHVGIVIAVSKDPTGKIKTVHTLGGNQSNCVSISEMAASRVIAVRRYYAVGPPDSVKQYVIDSTGKLSSNEA